MTSYACYKIDIDFSMGDYLMDGESILQKFQEVKDQHYSDFGQKTSFYTHNVTTNWLSEENQLQLL